MKPILFNTEMVQAILDGRKTVTRRVAFHNKDLHSFKSNEYPDCWWFKGRVYKDWGNLTHDLRMDKSCKYKIGDILYVRETWCWRTCWGCGMITGECCRDETAEQLYNSKEGEWGCYVYKASFEYKEALFDVWHPSIHMPKEAARLFLRVTDVRVERLQDIENNNEEARREGFDWQYIDDDFSVQIPPWVSFSVCWNDNFKKSDLAKYGWDANPWVWVIEFDRISKEEA